MAAPAPIVLATRELLPPPHEPPVGRIGYGYFLLTRTSDSIAQRRYVAACEAYQSLPTDSSYRDSRWERLVATYWPIDTAAPRGDTSCEWLLRHYDYAFGDKLATAFGVIGARGPVLVATTQPYSTQHRYRLQIEEPQTSPAGMIIDLSNYADEDMRRALGLWRHQISRDPTAWRDGLPLVRAREGLRNFLQAYGDVVMAFLRGN